MNKMGLIGATGGEMGGLQEMGAEGETESWSTIEEYGSLIKRGMSKDLSRSESNGICYMADGCDGSKDLATFRNFCENNGIGCDQYKERRRNQ